MSAYDDSDYQLGSVEGVLLTRFDRDSFRKVAEDVYSAQLTSFNNHFQHTECLVSLFLDNRSFLRLQNLRDAIKNGDRLLLQRFFSKVPSQILDKNLTLRDTQIHSEAYQSFLYFTLMDHELPVHDHPPYKDNMLKLLNDSLCDYEWNQYKNTFTDDIVKFEKSHKINLQPFIKTVITESELYNYNDRYNAPVIPDDYFKPGIIEDLLNQSPDITAELVKDLNFIDELKSLLIRFHYLYRTNPDSDTAINVLFNLYENNIISLN